MKIELEFQNRQQIEELYWALSTCYREFDHKREKEQYIVQILSESTNISRREDLQERTRNLNQLNEKLKAIDHLQNQLNTQVRYKSTQ
jgi:hypothetical protein